MLAGCSNSTLLSPRHRLRSESPAAQFQACHFQLPSMNTQRLDLPCSFSHKESSRSQIRPVGVGIDKPLESKASSCSLKKSIRLPPLATTAQPVGKSLKRFADSGSVDESCNVRAKKKRGRRNEEDLENKNGKFWFSSGLEGPGNLNATQVPFSLTCSGDEERVCFVPSDMISQPLPLSNNPWVDSAITKITNFGEQVGESSQRPVTEASGSSASSENNSSVGLRLGEHVVEHEVGNGSRDPQTAQGSMIEEVAAEEGRQDEFHGFELVSLLAACVEAIRSKDIIRVNHCIAKLGDIASPRGNPISRVAAYYTEALALRVTRLWPHVFHITPPRELDRIDDDTGIALRLLNQVTPITKFVHFTANEILLRSFEGKDKVHIIDFDIKQGLQWPSLLQSLASRTDPPSHVRITGVGDSKQDLYETGERLAGFAEALNLPFEFHPVVDRLDDVRLWMLHVKEGETVAVNCIFQMHKTIYDRRALRDFLGLIQSTNPTMVLMAEQEAEHNATTLEARVCYSLRYYSAIFDAIDSSLPLDSVIRMKIEEMFAREIRNIVACEGSNRHERHESFGKWKALMEQGGFRCVGVSERELLQGRMLLKMYNGHNYRVQTQNQNQALTLSWLDQPLYTVSAWASSDLSGGSSSSFSQAN